ncbi:hypothetical protein BU23DRAFT_584815 [Bimuria novae-zelandiae CBS 107.79]|uniref:Uncharacterized protein n=1 Tax=Bimuria novae-zelandiae CBS 107.79 TaxID=1447943 RepID=A0A6A5UN65_9PLEO|nr:hypothetical protein BU23DRAFT_584815 [Bimuria novae-zelandiae CBS 107.79]
MVLRHRGVYTGNNRARLANSLYNLEARPPAIAYCEITPFPQQPVNGVPGRPPELLYDPYMTLPPRWSRDVYDLLNNKIKIFFSICWQVDIHEEGDSFSNAYTVIKNHFNHDITTTFARTRIENPDKSLYKNFKGKDALQLKIALFKLAIICEGLFANLYNDSRREFTTPRWKKKCFVCQKEGCWLTNHTNEERKAARTQFFSACYFTGTLLPADFSVHLAEYKGMFIHHISGKDIYSRDVLSSPASQFLIEDRYTRSVYQGILPDTGAANVSTVGKEQYLALIQEDLTVTMDTSTAGKTSIKFGKGSVTVSIGTAQIPTEIGKIDFEVLDAPTPFLLCLADMDRLKVYFNNTTDKLVQGNFTLKDNYYFNYEILVDVMYLRSKPTLYETWQALRMFAEFRAKAKIMGVTCKQVPIEAHWSVGKIERYHAPLHRAWDILYAELAGTMSDKAILQMAVKAINDTAGPNGLVLTLLIFGAYPRMTIESPPSPLMVADALNTRNGPNTADMLALPLQSEVLHASPIDIIVPLAKQLRKRGHLPGLRNKRKANVYITKKEEANLKLAIKLRNNRISNLRVIIALAPMLAYPQAQTNLKRIILAHLPTELAPRYPEGTLLYVIKPLYRIAEAGVYWWTTYHRHHCKELDMSTLIYDPCLLVINSNADDFGMFRLKLKTILTLNAQLDFNSYTLIIDATQQPSDKDIKALNKRLKWQIENLNRGLRYIPITLIDAKLMLGFILMLINKSIDGDNTFTICGNIIHYSLIKCKRVTRSVLASKIYGMVNGFDIGIAIATTLQIIIERLGLPAVPLVICTDSYSLYECLVKLGTTKEKRLMIDIMALRQSYERREIIEI